MFYEKAIDLKVLVTLGKIVAAKNSGTIETEKAMHKLLGYCDTHTNDTLGYKASGMILKANSDA